MPLGLVRDVLPRTIELAVFAQLPDKAYALWDWTSGNEGCPATGSVNDVPECHKFEAHMGWLNSNHFLPQAGTIFQRYHELALQRARVCQEMAATLSVAGRDEPDVLQACDREALLLEAIAQHYLQDAWSMGHMWQRWGSPELEDFASALSADKTLGDIDSIGDAVGRGSGIIHGAKAITHLADAMCAPDSGIEFVFNGAVYPGAGDLYLDAVEVDERFDSQFEFMYRCSVTSMREVYLASARSFGPPGPSQAATMDLAACFTQRATNRALGLGSAIQVPIVLAASLSNVAMVALAAVSDRYLRSLELDPSGRSDYYLPLTSELLTTVDLPGVLIPRSVRTRWHNDMARIQFFLSFSASNEAGAATLADGDLGPLLDMEPNAFYQGKAALSSYTDPPLPWTPTPTDVELSSTAANAANILSRTFREAHIEDWCGVLHEGGTDEFSLTHLRDTCISLRDQGADAETACGVCASFAEWMVFDAEPDVAANPALAEAPLCSILTGSTGIQADSEEGDFDRQALAKRWCEDAPISVLVAASTEVQYRDFISYCRDLIENNFLDTVEEDRVPPVLLVAGSTRVAIAQVDEAFEVRYGSTISADSEPVCPDGGAGTSGSDITYAVVRLRVHVRHSGTLVFDDVSSSAFVETFQSDDDYERNLSSSGTSLEHGGSVPVGSGEIVRVTVSEEESSGAVSRTTNKLLLRMAFDDE